MTHENRTARFHLRLTESERDVILKAADLGGEDLSTFIRRMALVGAHKAIATAAKDRRDGA